MVLCAEENIEREGRGREHDGEDCEIRADQPRDHFSNLYPTPHTVVMTSPAPAFFNLRRSWLT